jgi:hypothetical protein
VLAGERETLLFFADPLCSACDALLPEIGRRQRDPSDGPAVVMLSGGDPELNRAKTAEHGIAPVLLHEGFELPRSLGMKGLPAAVLVDGDGRVASDPATGNVAIEELLASVDAPLLTVIEAVH